LNNEFPSQYIKDNMLVTTSGNFSDAALLCALLTLGADRILFSIDYPYQRIANGAQFIETAPISDADRAKFTLKTQSGCSNRVLSFRSICLCIPNSIGGQHS
jgi:predicted TIM-barrel fold metal-dependent hydrolase